MAKKEKVRKVNVPRIIVVLLIIYVLGYTCYYVYSAPISHYEITGNTYVSDNDILRAAKLDNYPSFITLSFKNTEKKIKKLDLIKDVKIKYGWNFSIKIEVTENPPVFVKKLDNMIVLSDGTEIENTNQFVGVPILLNDTPTIQLKMLASNLAKVDDGIVYAINEIEYNPSYNSSNKVIDENRFLLYMNDQNTVYINARKTDILNHYLDVIATNEITGTGTFYLDGDEERYSYIERTTEGTTNKKEETTVPVDPNVDDGVSVQGDAPTE